MPLRHAGFVAFIVTLAAHGAGCSPADTTPPIAVTPVTVSQIYFARNSYSIAEVDLTRVDLQLLWKTPGGTPYSNFAAVRSDLARQHRDLLFATNAGIFAADFTPLGLHVEAGQEIQPLNLRNGVGNFYLKPNGVFFLSANGARIIDSVEYPNVSEKVRLAIQSGPLLVSRGTINKEFAAGSDNKKIRSAIGLPSPQRAIFVLSDDPVSFHELASLFQDHLRCSDALYLDGEISQFYAPSTPTPATSPHFAAIITVTSRTAETPHAGNP
jgi:uncharacterized protein YigE (DUF2233 family)